MDFFRDEREDALNEDERETVAEEVTRETIEETPIAEDAPAVNEPRLSAFTVVEAEPEPSSAKSHFWRNLAAAVLVVAIGGGAVGAAVGIGIGVGQGLTGNAASVVYAPAPTERFTFPETPVKTAAFDDNAAVSQAPAVGFAELVELVEPSVVTIVSHGESAGYSMFGGRGTYPTEGAGTGILFHEDSEKYYIVTNYHVVQNANTVQISIGGKGPFDAKMIDKRENSDVAVVSISRADVAAAGVGNVRIATFGDSDALRVGDVVLAIGNALGEGNTATDGIISAKNKRVVIDNVTYNALQTNAAINPGNSGGPLVNAAGEVVGINSAKLSGTTTSASGVTLEGLGYAIPSNEVKALIEEIMAPPKPLLGIKGGDLTEALAEMYGLPQAGVYVSTIMEGYPAEAAGLQSGDIITKINDTTVLTFSDLKGALAQCEDGDKVTVNVVRGMDEERELLTITVKLFLVDAVGF